MSDVIEKLKNYKIEIPISTYRKKIDVIKQVKQQIKKIKYLSENSQGKLVVKSKK